jgi:ABC-type Fe3+-citrate transport system substrate-binding protein
MNDKQTEKMIEMQKKVEDHERWIEEWKKLPQLPKPKR